MDEFKVKLDRMRGSADESKKIVRELSRARNDLLGIKRRLSFRISQRERIDRRLNMQMQALDDKTAKLDKATSTLSRIIELYEKTEMELCGQKAPDRGKSLVDVLLDIIWPPRPGVDPWPHVPPRPPFNPNDFFKYFPPFIPHAWIPVLIPMGYPPLVPIILIAPWIYKGHVPLPWILSVLKGPEIINNGGGEKVLPWKSEWKWGDPNEEDTKIRADTTECVVSKAIKDAAKRGEKDGAKGLDKAANAASDGYEKVKDKVDDFADKHSTTKETKRVYDTETKQWTKVDTEDEKATKAFDDELERSKMGTDVKATLFTASASGALWSGEAAAEGKIGGVVPGSASAKASFGEAEAHADGYMGLFQADPTTGELQFKPGIGVSAGASVTAFTAEEQAMLGNDMLGAYVKSTQTVGKVGAEAEANVGLYDKDGKFNPTAYAGFSAQAIAGEITGAVGAKVLGADVSASGSLNYGVGAHANVGYKDGKLSLDVGATLGVGASVKLEVDIGGTIDAVKDAGKAAWDKAGDALDSVKGGLKKLKFW